MTTGARSIRGRRQLLLACIMLVAVGLVSAALAPAWRQSAGAPHEGHDLSVYGPQASGVIGIKRVHQGTTYRFAFPVPHNDTAQPIRLTGASVRTTPAGAQVVGYPIYSLDEVGDYLLNYDDSDQVGVKSLQTVKDYAKAGITIPPRSDSKYFVMVAVRVMGPVTEPLRGCTFEYTVRSQKYYQNFPCEFRLGDNG